MTDQELENAKMQYEDKVIMLETGVVLVARVVQNADEDFIVMYKPGEVIEMADGSVFIRRWFIESDDDYVIIPIQRIMTIGAPGKVYLDSYLSVMGFTEESFAPEGTILH